MTESYSWRQAARPYVFGILPREKSFARWKALEGHITQIAFFPNGKRALAYSIFDMQAGLRLWDLSTSKQLAWSTPLPPTLFGHCLITLSTHAAGLRHYCLRFWQRHYFTCEGNGDLEGNPHRCLKRAK